MLPCQLNKNQSMTFVEYADRKFMVKDLCETIGKETATMSRKNAIYRGRADSISIQRSEDRSQWTYYRKAIDKLGSLQNCYQ